MEGKGCAERGMYFTSSIACGRAANLFTDIVVD